MAYIGKTPTSAPLTASDITDGIISTDKLANSAVSTAKIADDAVGNTKLDLSADYTFTGTVSGAGGGKIGQIISQTLAPCQTSTSGTAFVDTSFSINITPSATSSKIYITFTCGGVYHNQSQGGSIRVRYNDDTSLYDTGSYTAYKGSQDIQIGSSISVLHSPNTTAQKNYKIQIANRTSSGSMYIGHPNNSSTHGTLTCMEVLA